MNKLLNMSVNPLKWGFFGAGKCTSDFASALKLLPKESHKSIGVASRDLERARDFAQRLSLPKHFGSYLELAQDTEIDVIYIGTVNSEHFEQAKLAMENGKNVLCEKAMCVNYKQTKELVDLARERKVFLMEGFWTNFFPCMKKFDEELKTNSIGEIVHLVLQIGNPFGHTDRFRVKELGGGAILNHGVYGLMMACKYFGKPDKIVATGHLTPEGVDKSAVIALSYKDKAQLATFVLSSRATLSNELVLFGTNGKLKLHYPFWAPQSYESPTGSFHFDIPKAPDSTTFHYPYVTGFIYEAEEVRRCISQGLLESPLMPLDLSINTIQVADEVRRQIGVILPQDLS